MTLTTPLATDDTSLLFCTCFHPCLRFVKCLSAVLLSSNRVLPSQPSFADTLGKPAFHVLTKFLNNNVEQNMKVHDPACGVRDLLHWLPPSIHHRCASACAPTRQKNIYLMVLFLFLNNVTKNFIKFLPITYV